MARRKIYTDDGRIEDADMEEAKSSNKELGLPDLDDEEGRSGAEPDGEDNPKKQKEPKNAKSKASAKAEARRARKEEDDEEEDEEEYESKKSKKEAKKPKWWKEAVRKNNNEEDDEEEDDEEEVEENLANFKGKKAKPFKKGGVGKTEQEGEEDDEEDEDEVEEGRRYKYVERGDLPSRQEEDDEEDSEDDEEDEEEVESKKSKKESKRKKEEFPPAKDDEEEDDEEETESKKSKKEEIDVDVSEDVAALIDGENLSEDFKTKAATIFEAAVKSKISKIRKQIREDSKKSLARKTKDMQTDMTEKMDEYMNYVVKEWMTENKLAVEQGVRNEVTESFISGLKKLFEEHYIDVPAEKEDVFESLVQEVAEVETKLDEQTQKHMDTLSELNTYRAKDAFRDVVEGMVDTDVEKMKELIEDVDYESDKQYKEKLNIIKNSYFKSEKKLGDNKGTAATNKKITDGTSDGSMDSVMAAISNLNKVR